MKPNHTLMRFLSLCSIFLSCHVAHAESATGNAEVSAGVEHNSNLNIPELNQNSHTSDIAATTGLALDGQWKATKRLTLKAGYGFSSKNYRRHSEYDLSLHQLSAEAKLDLDVADVGVSHHYAAANLNKNKFLTLRQTSIFAGKLIQDKVYLRAAATIQDKQFASLPERNASNHGVAGDAFIFFNEGKTFVNVGLNHENEATKTKQFDYTGNAIKTSVSHQYNAWNTAQKLEAGTRYGIKNYEGITPEINRARKDEEQVSEVAWEVSLTPKITATTKVEYGNYRSNLPSTAYTDTKTSVNLTARF